MGAVGVYTRTMRVRPLLVGFAAVVALLVGACAPEAKDAKSPGCVMAAAMFPGCAVDIDVDSPEKLQSTRQTAINKRTNLARALTAFCPDSVTSAALKSEDACAASVDAVMPQATTDAAKRRAAAGPAVAALRADARYASARDRFHTLRIQQSTACDTADATACKLAQGDADGAAAVMGSLLTEYRIESPRRRRARALVTQSTPISLRRRRNVG